MASSCPVRGHRTMLICGRSGRRSRPGRSLTTGTACAISVVPLTWSPPAILLFGRRRGPARTGGPLGTAGPPHRGRSRHGAGITPAVADETRRLLGGQTHRRRAHPGPMTYRRELPEHRALALRRHRDHRFGLRRGARLQGEQPASSPRSTSQIAHPLRSTPLRCRPRHRAQVGGAPGGRHPPAAARRLSAVTAAATTSGSRSTAGAPTCTLSGTAGCCSRTARRDGEIGARYPRARSPPQRHRAARWPARREQWAMESHDIARDYRLSLSADIAGDHAGVCRRPPGPSSASGCCAPVSGSPQVLETALKR